MALRVGINGYGRIGRNILRALYEMNRREEIQVVAINDLSDPQMNAHLTRYDSTHGPFKVPVTVAEKKFIINGDEIALFASRDPKEIPWGEAGVDIVLECTGHFTTKEKAGLHLASGAKKVLISAPASDAVDATIVYGVNHQTLKASDTIVSNASCTTNCLAPLVQPLQTTPGIINGLMTTVHAYTNDQVLVDSSHSDLRRARAAAHSLIPTKTGAAQAVGLVLPALNGKLDGLAVRVPTLNVSLVDLTFTAAKATSVKEINALLQAAASHGPLKDILVYNDAPLVSIDFNHHPASCVFDATQTRVIDGTLVKVMAWYDNEWGFSNRMIDVALAMQAAQ